MVVMIVIIISNFVLYITSAMAYYYIKYDIGNLDLLFPFLAFGGVVQISAVVLYPRIAKTMPRKKIYNLSIIIQLNCVLFFSFFLNSYIEFYISTNSQK